MCKYDTLLKDLEGELLLIEEAEKKLADHKATVLKMLEEVKYTLKKPSFELSEISVLRSVLPSRTRRTTSRTAKGRAFRFE